MKPLTLALTGFRSYPSPVTVEFTGKSLVAALGDTGSGKSSLLDAIVFALFRKSSWDAKEPRQLIADGMQAMNVELTFLHDGQRWCVHRTMHATNPNAGRHHLKNLDTGEETDGATAVDNRIKAVLQMGYDTFLRVGLLPQGKFDQLLTAAPKERSERLRELFGAESLESVQQMAVRHSQTLQALLSDARAERAPMPVNPEQAAEEAGAAADAATARTERLEIAIERITALRGEVSAARDAAAAATITAETLSARAVTDASATLDALEPIATDIAARHDALDRRAAQAAAREEELTAAITAADAAGEGRDVLTKATMILKALATHAEEHRGERDRLATLTEQLADERDAIANAEAELAERAEHAKPLAEQARAAAETSNQIRTCATTVHTALTTALTAARRVAGTASAHAMAVSRRESARDDLGRVETETEAARRALAEADAHLEALRRRDKAAAIAAELRPGDNCLVCHQQLPADFAPAPDTDAAELATATDRLSRAKTARDTAVDRLAGARAAVTAAEEAILEREKEHQSAQQTAQEASAEAVRAFGDLAALAAETRGGFDAESASAILTAATASLSAPTADGAAQLEQDTVPIADAITACEQAATTHAEQLQAEGHRRTAEIEADRKTLTERTRAHQRHTDDTAKASERYTRAVARTVAEVSTLPSRIRAMLPNDAIDVVADEAAAATAAVAARQAEVQELLDQREEARAEKATVLVDQRALDQDTQARLERPLNKLRDNLDAWAQAVTQTITHLDVADQHQAPKAPIQSRIAEIRKYAAALSTTTSTLGDKLTQRATAAADRSAAAKSSLGEYAAALADVDGFDTEADLTTPEALHPLVATAAQAAKEAKDQRKKQREAQDLIKPAAALDFAITAGKARYEALEVLRRELVDAKFLGHLTTLRTRALLGVASDLLGQMSDGRFGFADSFDIVSRTSGVVHHPNRLSGGEKFQASLALALALAELHSRSGPALGSLFLDEGFAALDTTALDSALEVLRTRAGSDRLVMVISHLHAVAEAVDDVLWVKRTTAGSSARWLTPAERDELAQADLASGLQALAR
ncbi:AAA family ATPase [Streptomyces sp. PT12]|uniref:AAA family ATPase n=1 Tax=Streptomyces sp. PT12 TaxID=1510197 RepID=UPI000DE23678|nr:SMC family ATPase [Streptomyces sp. PT12]RBM08666.1 recombination protein RecF [Streptomyces sp. PT12]